MAVTQFCISLDNVPGKLAELSNRLGYAGINIRAISLNSSKKTSRLHLVVNDSVGAERVLHEAGMSFIEERVLAVELPNVPGALAECSKVLAEEDVNIEYMYPFISRTPNAVIIMKTDNLIKTEEKLMKRKVRMLGEDELYSLE